MTRPTLQQRSDRIGLKVLLVVVVLTVVVFGWNRTTYQRLDQTPDTWVDAGGRLHVLGLTLGETTLRQAETTLQSRSDVALYLYPTEHPRAGRTLEAFFPAIADHTKVILLLDADMALLDRLEARATVPHLYPNTVARMNLDPGDLHSARVLPILQLTLIPSIRLDEPTLVARFGSPDYSESQQDGSKEFHYAAIGLRARMAADGTTQLHFVTP